jgi:hypothetical protein
VLAYAADRRPDDALAAADSLPALAAGTYIDKMTAALGRAFALIQLDRSADAEAALADAVALVDATDDVLDQAIARLARGTGLMALGRMEAGRVLKDSEARLASMGIDAHGWETAFRLATGR